jgi:hypothetical protein
VAHRPHYGPGWLGLDHPADRQGVEQGKLERTELNRAS